MAALPIDDRHRALVAFLVLFFGRDGVVPRAILRDEFGRSALVPSEPVAATVVRFERAGQRTRGTAASRMLAAVLRELERSGEVVRDGPDLVRVVDANALRARVGHPKLLSALPTEGA